MEILTNDLKRSVKIDLYKKFLINCKILSDNLSEQFLEDLCSKVKSYKCSPGEVIFRSGD